MLINSCNHYTKIKSPFYHLKNDFHFLSKIFFMIKWTEGFFIFIWQCVKTHQLKMLKFLRAPILKNNCERLLLSHRYLVKRQTKHHYVHWDGLTCFTHWKYFTKVRRLKLRFIKMWDKVFKSRLSTFCGRQPLATLKGYGLLKRTISLQIF